MTDFRPQFVRSSASYFPSGIAAMLLSISGAVDDLEGVIPWIILAALELWVAANPLA